VRLSTENWLYLENGERNGLGYYQSLIESRILAFKLPANHRPYTCKLKGHWQPVRSAVGYPSDSWGFLFK